MPHNHINTLVTTMLHTYRITVVALSLVVVGLPMAVLAQATLEEVVVTAQKRAESIQEVPISINVISGEEIVSSGITDLGDLGPYVPNFSYNQTGISSTLKMRGISSGINPGFEQSVGTYVDGIYYGRGQLSRIPYVDLGRVEVLRGPQSVIFGKNTIAGALNVQTARPTDKLDGYVRLSYDQETGREESSFAVGGLVSKGFSARISYMLREVDGYYENTTLGVDESDDKEETIRLGLLFGNDVTSLYFKAERNTFDNLGRFLEIVNPVGAVPFAAVLGSFFDASGDGPGSLVNPRVDASNRYALDTRRDYRRQSNGDISFNEHTVYMVEFNHTLGDGGRLTVLGGRNSFDTDELCDCDFSGANVFTASSVEEYDQSSLEVRYTSPGDAVVDYVVGGYLQSYDQQFDDVISLPLNGVLPAVVLSGAVSNLSANPAAAPLAAALGDAVPELVGMLAGSGTRRAFTQESSVWSLFAQVTYNINEDMRLVFGGRYTEERKTGTRRQFHVDRAGTDLGTSNVDFNGFYALVGIESYGRLRSSRKEDVFTPLITWQWDFMPGKLWYATYTQGYKAGGYDVRSNQHPGLDYRTNPTNPVTPYVLPLTGANAGLSVAATARLASLALGSFEYEEERADTFETGVKSILAGGAAEFNVSLYLTSYEDLQISQFDGVLGFNVTNAGEASIAGVEMDTRWNITENFQFKGSLAFLDFEYDEFPNAECDFASIQAGLIRCDLAGRTTEFAPEVTALLSLDYGLPTTGSVDVALGVDVEYSDDYFVSPTLDDNLRQDSFARVDGRLKISPEAGRWQLLLTVKNMTNQVVNTFGNRVPLSTTLTGGRGTAYYSFFQPPRSFLFQYSYNF